MVYLFKEAICVLTVSELMMGKGNMPAGIWWGNLTQRDQLENLGVDRNGCTRNTMGGLGLDWSHSG